MYACCHYFVMKKLYYALMALGLANLSGIVYSYFRERE